MKKIHKLAGDIATKAELIEYEIRKHNPGTESIPMNIEKIIEKSISLDEKISDLIELLEDKE